MMIEKPPAEFRDADLYEAEQGRPVGRHLGIDLRGDPLGLLRRVGHAPPHLPLTDAANRGGCKGKRRGDRCNTKTNLEIPDVF
jgi:hypothetical protein